MRIITRKVYLSILTFALVLTSAVASSYAWITLNRTSYIDKLSFDIAGEEGFAISVDGQEFKSVISELEIKSAILRKKGLDTSKLTEKQINSNFSLIKFEPITTNDLDKFTEIDGTTVSDAYVSFDIYFTSNKANLNGDGIDVFFSDSKIISSNSKSFDLINPINIGFNDHVFGTKIPTKIKAAAENAARIAYVKYDACDINKVEDSSSNPIKKIFSPGKAEHSISFDGVYNFGNIDSVFNANIAYYNDLMNTNILANIPKNRNDEILDCQKIIASTDGLYQDKMIKVTYFVWLEGWDPDCFDPVSNQTVNIELKLTLKNPKNN